MIARASSPGASGSLLLDDERAAAIGEPAGVGALVIPGRVREGDEDRRAAVGGDLGDRPGAGPRDHQVGRAVPLAHRVEEGGDLGRSGPHPDRRRPRPRARARRSGGRRRRRAPRPRAPAARRRPAGSPRGLPGSRRARAGAGRGRARPPSPAPSASSRTGLPARTARPAGKWRRAGSKAMKTLRAIRARRRFVSPGTAFCSCSTTGMPSVRAATRRRPRGVAAGAEQQVGAERGDLAAALADRAGGERQGRDGARAAPVP